jgi:hypothetical protein
MWPQDVAGFLLAVVVTANNAGDRMGAKLLVIALLDTCDRLKRIWADSGYDGKPLATWVREPAQHEFAVTITPAGQTVRLHTQDGLLTWPLPTLPPG